MGEHFDRHAAEAAGGTGDCQIDGGWLDLPHDPRGESAPLNLIDRGVARPPNPMSRGLQPFCHPPSATATNVQPLPWAASSVVLFSP